MPLRTPQGKARHRGEFKLARCWLLPELAEGNTITDTGSAGTPTDEQIYHNAR